MRRRWQTERATSTPSASRRSATCCGARKPTRAAAAWLRPSARRVSARTRHSVRSGLCPTLCAAVARRRGAAPIAIAPAVAAVRRDSGAAAAAAATGRLGGGDDPTAAALLLLQTAECHARHALAAGREPAERRELLHWGMHCRLRLARHRQQAKTALLAELKRRYVPGAFDADGDAAAAQLRLHRAATTVQCAWRSNSARFVLRYRQLADELHLRRVYAQFF